MSELALQLIAKEKKAKTGKLDLGNCGLRNLPPELFELTWLEELILSNDLWDIEKREWVESKNKGWNNLSSLPPEMAELSQLKVLYCRGDIFDKWKIKDISIIQYLRQLKILDIGDNQIIDASFLSNLSGLQTLDISSNQIIDASFLSSLSGLQTLSISGNQIIDASFLSNLSGLQTLDISFNQIIDVSFLSSLLGLQTLSISHNKINHIDKKIAKRLQLVYEEEYYLKEGEINVYNNPIISPPIETIKQGQEAIERYFERMERETEKAPLYEAKVLLVGRTGAGKTSLRYKLKDINKLMPAPDESTRGVDVEAIEFKMKNGLPFRMNVWDFEGQIIAHQTHQFFLSKRALYVFVCDHRTEKVDTDYWLKIAELLGGESPMLIFHNEKEGEIARLGWEAMQERFKAFLQKKQYRADLEALAEGKQLKLKQRKKFKKFKKVLQKQLTQLPIVGIPLEKSWVDTRQAVEELAKEKAIIEVGELWDICQKNGVTQTQDQKDLSQLFHDLGIFLHFQDKPEAKKTWLGQVVILQNEWATKAVYQVLKSEYLEKEKLGHFTLPDLKKVWQKKQTAGIDYTCRADALLELMMKFKICYQIRQTAQYILPQLLPASPPKDYQFPQGDVLQLRYTYDFMPKGIITRLTVEMHKLIAKGQTLAWKDGFVVEDLDAIAEVVETYGKREIHIKAVGNFARKLLNRIAIEMDKINSEYNFNENIKAYKMLPCNCADCIATKEPHFFKYRELLVLKGKNWRDAPCGKFGNPAPINDLLALILEGRDREMLENHKMYKEVRALRYQQQKHHQDLKKDFEELKEGNRIVTDILEYIAQISVQNHLKSREINEQLDNIDAHLATLPEKTVFALEKELQKHLTKFFTKLPDNHELTQQWKKFNSPEVNKLEARTRVKVGLNLGVIVIEQELTGIHDMTPNLREAIQDLKRFFKASLGYDTNKS